MIAVICVSLVLLLTIAIYRYYASRPNNLPPGPAGFPLLGCAPYISANEAFLTLSEWKKKYGPLMSFYMGNRLIVVLGDTETIKEALIKQGDVFSGRPQIRIPKFLLVRRNPNIGIINADGALWREQRRFALSTLRDFGFGRPLMETKIREEVEFVIEELSSYNGQPFDPQKLLNNSVSNVICSLVFGKRFDYNDKNFLGMMNSLNFLLSTSGTNILSLHHYFPPMLLFNNFLPVRDALKKLVNFNQIYIDEHKKTFDPRDEPNDYIHAYMKAQADGMGYSMDDANLNCAIGDLFAAGTETTATTLRWALVYIGSRPEIQDKILEEIETQLGAGNIPTWTDRHKLPYTEAVIMEIQRISNLGPMALPHRTVADTTLMGYHIPKDATVIPLLWAVHRESPEFEEAAKFDPMRFLEQDGQTIKKYESFMPFSAGKRICLGESLAKMELFLFFTAIIVRFRIHFEGIGEPSPDEYYSGITITPKPFRVIAEPRH